jgi:hypothetical protein
MEEGMDGEGKGWRGRGKGIGGKGMGEGEGKREEQTGLIVLFYSTTAGDVGRYICLFSY